MARLRAHYQTRLSEGSLAPDPAQAVGLSALERVERELAAKPGLLSRRKAVRGVYLFGPPGRGKSMLADLLFAAAPAPAKRAHFHAFMGEVHGLARAWREGDAAARKAKFGTAKGDDPIPPLAKLVLGDARLLIFDEMQVSDIADAMILSRLFEAMMALGATIVVTSNRPPEDLYKDGINRQIFLPFIAMLREKLEVVEMTGATDWRLSRLRAARRWFSPLDDEAKLGFEALWREVSAGQTASAEIEVLGRTIAFRQAAGGAARASFAELCEAMLGPQDYLAISQRFSTLFLEDVPLLGPDNRQAARRLVTLIDALYEARARLVVLAAGEPTELYPAGDGAFEFERTVSRLEQMRSDGWLDQPTS